MKKKAALLALVASLSISTAMAQAKYPLIGAGASSCGKWNATFADKENIVGRFQFTSWVQGYLSGMNQALSIVSTERKLLLLPDPDALESFVSNHCAAHPLESVSEASFALFMAVTKRRQN